MTAEPLRRCDACGHLAYRDRECQTCRLLRRGRIHDDRLPRPHDLCRHCHGGES